MTSAGQATSAVCSRRLLEGAGSFRHGSNQAFARHCWERLVTEKTISMAVEVQYPNLEIHRPPLRRLLLKLGAEPREIDDFIQQTFTKILIKIEAGDAIENLAGYCFRVATHLYVSAWRKQDRSRVDFDSAVLEESPTSPDEVWRNEPERKLLADEELRGMLREAKAALGEQGSNIMLLVRGEGLSDLETARQMGLSESAVRRHKTKVNKWCDAKRKEGK